MDYNKKRLLLKPDFCYYHIPKCGGSTVRATLYNFFSKLYTKSEIYCPEKSDVKFNFADVKSFREFVGIKTEEQLSQIKILLCHTRYNTPDISDEFNEHISDIILRNPTSRIISHYEFFNYPKTKVHMNELSNNQLKEYCIRMSSVMTNYLSDNNDLVDTWLKEQPNPTEVHNQYDYEFIKKQLQNYLNPGSAEEDTPAAGSETTPESSSPQKTDFTLETATAGNKDTVSKFDDLFNE